MAREVSARLDKASEPFKHVQCQRITKETNLYVYTRHNAPIGNAEQRMRAFLHEGFCVVFAIRKAAFSISAWQDA
jgi:hypothetical protein